MLNLDLTRAVARHGLHFAPDPSSQQSCSIGGNVATNSGRPALPGRRRHQRPRPGRRGGAARRRGRRARRRRPRARRATTCAARSSAARARSGSPREIAVRLTPNPPAVRTMLLDFADVDDGAATVSGDHRRRHRARGHRDDGRPHHRGGRGVRPRRLPARRRRRPHRGGRRPAEAGVEDAVKRVDRDRPGPRGARRCGWRPTRPSGRSSGRAARPPSVRSPGSSRTTTCTTPSCRARRLVEVLREVYEIADAPRPARDERLPRRRRQPAPAARVRQARAGRDGARACRRGGDRAGQRGRRRGAVGRARHRPREAGLHAAHVLRRRPRRPGHRSAGPSIPTAWPTRTRCSRVAAGAARCSTCRRARGSDGLRRGGRRRRDR